MPLLIKIDLLLDVPSIFIGGVAVINLLMDFVKRSKLIGFSKYR